MHPVTAAAGARQGTGRSARALARDLARGQAHRLVFLWTLTLVTHFAPRPAVPAAEGACTTVHVVAWPAALHSPATPPPSPVYDAAVPSFSTTSIRPATRRVFMSCVLCITLKSK